MQSYSRIPPASPLEDGNSEARRFRTTVKKKWYSLRHPKGAGSFFILFLNLLYFSYQHNAIYNLLKLTSAVSKADPWMIGFLSALLSDSLPQLLYPLAGWFSDAKFGRQRMIIVGMCITWLGAVLLLATYLIRIVIFPESDSTTAMIVVVVILYIFIAVGTACFQVNIIPFGIDQMEDCSSEEVGSFINWYYWTRNVNFGVVVQFGISGAHFYCATASNSPVREQYDLIISLIQVIFLTVALSLMFLFSTKLLSDPLIYSPISKVKLVTTYILKHSRPVGYRRAHTYTLEDPPVRSDFAKKSYGGCFEEDDVEEVATFWRMVVFLIPVGIAYYVVLTGTYSYSNLFEHMEKKGSTCVSKYAVTNMIYVITYAVCIPAYEFLIYPFFRNYNPRLIVKIGMGMMIMLIGCFWAVATDETGHIYTHYTNNSSYSICFFYNLTTTQHLEFSPYTIIPCIVILTVGELFTIISSLEFICAQSPSSMRSLLIGILYFIDGIGAGIASLTILFFAVGFKNHTDHIQFSCCSSYYLTVLIIGIAGFIFYYNVAKWYKNRQRGGQSSVNYQSVLEGYYERYIRQRNSLQSQVT